MRLIDADVLENQNICDYCEKNNHCYELECFNWYEEETVRKMIKQAPSIDAVPVVRCKDCRHGNDDSLPSGFVYCDKLERTMPSNGYCSFGERKEDLSLGIKTIDKEVQDEL